MTNLRVGSSDCDNEKRNFALEQTKEEEIFLLYLREHFLSAVKKPYALDRFDRVALKAYKICKLDEASGKDRRPVHG